MVDPTGSKPAVGVDGAGVDPKNAINVVMEDLDKEDRKEVDNYGGMTEGKHTEGVPMTPNQGGVSK
jgi:hypothetical protein